MLRRLLIIAALAPLTLAGCTSSRAPRATAPEAVTPAGLAPQTYPVVNFSTSTSLLMEVVRARVWGLSPELRRVTLYRDGLMLTYPPETPPEKLSEFSGTGRLEVPFGTHQAYLHLLGERNIPMNAPYYDYGVPSQPTMRTASKPAELIVVAREPSLDELKLAKQRNIGLDVRPVALDAFVFLVNSDNPVHSLTLDQIRGIFAGRITRWAALGGDDRQIVPFTRDPNSGSEELMESLVMKGQKIVAGKDPSSVLLTMSGPIARVSTVPNAISYSVFYYARYMNPASRSRLLAVNGVHPTPSTIADRTYPLTAEVYVVTRKDLASDSPAARLRDWLLSPQGQQMIDDCCYVPVKGGR